MRKQYLDIAKGIGIILVVLGHCPQVYNPLKQWIYAFHMPLFFFISGMVWNRESHEKRGFFTKRFLVDKIKRLIVPCYIWGTLYMALNALIDKNYSIKSIAFLIYGSQSGFSHAGSLTSLWFLPCMFIAVCLFEILQQCLHNSKIRIIALLIISAICTAAAAFLPRINGGFPWSTDVAFIALAFMIWGHLGCESIERLGKNKAFACVAAAVCLAILTATFSLNLPHIPINNADMAGRYFGNPFLYLLDAVAGTLSVLLISKSVRGIFGKGLTELGKRTIPIFIIHKPVVQVLNRVGQSLNIGSILIVGISSLVAIGVSLAVYEIVRRRCPIVFGEDN